MVLFFCSPAPQKNPFIIFLKMMFCFIFLCFLKKQNKNDQTRHLGQFFYFFYFFGGGGLDVTPRLFHADNLLLVLNFSISACCWKEMTERKKKRAFWWIFERFLNLDGGEIRAAQPAALGSNRNLHGKILKYFYKLFPL